MWSGHYIKTIMGSSFSDNFTANNLAATINGGGGTDTLVFTNTSLASGNRYDLTNLNGTFSNLSTIDLSKNKNTVSDIGFNYQISTSDIIAMAPTTTKNITFVTYNNGAGHSDTHTVFTASGISYTETGNVGTITTSSASYTVSWQTVNIH
jgi:hypothetical protein